jgi:TonB dependent receptor/CarboxypepD_reg-like domain/TonB-dependent Receptor Plug Domain
MLNQQLRLTGATALALTLLLTGPAFAQAPKTPATAAQATSVTMRGHLKDAASGEALIGASVGVKERPGVGAVANEYGFYSLTLPAGTYTLVVRGLGFSVQERRVTLAAGQNQTLDVELRADGQQLEEVVIASERQDRNVTSTEMGTMQIKASELKKIPALLGEVDVIRAVQLMPGVQTAGEGTGGFYVRGGGVDQNLILLDEATVYNASHLLGFFSVFNADAIKDVQLIKGGIGAEYGGRLSSVLDIRMKDGNAKRLAGEGGIGSISSRLTLEGNLGKRGPVDSAGNRAPAPGSWMVAGRRTYADVFFKLAKDKNVRDNTLYFYDLNMKANYKLTDRDQLFVSGYFGRDVSGNSGFGFDWGNATGTVRWNHLISDRLFSNTTAIFSDFNYSLGSREKASEFTWKSHIRDYSLKQDFTYYLNPSNTLRFGAIGTLHRFLPGNITPGPESYLNEIKLKGSNASEGAVYIANEQKFTPRLTVNYGLRLSGFANTGAAKVYKYASDAANTPSDTVVYKSGEIIKTYGGIEPRLAATYALNETASLKASYNRTRQYLHLLSNTTASLPFDVWTPATASIPPQTANQVSIGYFRNFKDNTYEASVETYYKTMDGQIDYKDNAQVLLNDRVERVILTGTGRSYGAEFLIRKQRGPLTGWVSYTLSKTERKVGGINGGAWYPVRYDRRHNLAVVASYQVSTRLNLGANWTYVTGGAVTMPVGRFEFEGVAFPYYSSRNGYRLPAYHRLDLAATLEDRVKPGRKFQGSWTLSLYNAYNRHNTFSIFFREKENAPGQTEAVRTYLFGIIPSVTYNFHF